MPKVNLPSDFAKEIAKSLGMTEKWVDEWFEIDENKEGYFIAKLKPKKFLEKDQFRTICALVRDLGGEGYLQGMKAWKLPSSFAKKPQPSDTTNTPAPTDTRSKSESSGVTPHVVSMDKTKSTYIMVPIKALLSMPFQSRTTADPELEELAESVKTYGMLEPILVRPKLGGLYEIVAGERRVKAAQKADLLEVPVIIKWLTDEETFIIQATENLQRKDWTEEEKTRYLGWLAKKTGWSAQQIADKLKMSYQWVVKYLPSEFKAEQQSEAGKASGVARAESVLQRGTETEEIPKFIPCARCGVATSEPIHLDGKFYCGQCAEKVVTQPPSQPSESSTEARRAVQPETPLEHGIDSEATYKEAGSEIPETKPVEVPESEPLLTGFEVECPECHKKLLINHIDHPNGKISHEVELQ
jgi:ParB/RepB/Spo0J family partition protein